MAAHGQYQQALAVLNGLGRDTRHLYEVELLRGALYSHLGMHERAVDELLLAIQTVRSEKRLSKAEANYLVAYAVQYWRHSAWQIGLRDVPRDSEDVLNIESPILAVDVPVHLRKKFPLKVAIRDVKIV